MIAQMVKLVDTPASGAGDLTVVEVRVFFWAPIQIQGYGLEFHKNPRKRVFAFPASENIRMTRVGAAEGCDLLLLILKIKIKRSQPAAAPTQGSVSLRQTRGAF